MSLVLSTLVIALFIVMPGAFLDHFISSGKLSRARAPTPVITDIAIYVALSLPVHAFTIAVLSTTGAFKSAAIDYQLFARAATGEFGANGDQLYRLAETASLDRLNVLGYLASTLMVAAVLGWAIQYMLLRFRALRHLLPFRNPWFDAFCLPSGPRISASRAFVLTQTSAWGGPLLYQGWVEDFRVETDGRLAELKLSKPLRSHLTARPGVEAGDKRGERSWTPLEQDLLIIPGTQIVNLTLSYQRAWRPWAILAKTRAALASQTRSIVDVSGDRSRTRRFWRWLLGTPNAFYVSAATESGPYAVSIEPLGGNKVALTLLDYPHKGLDVQVTAVKRLVFDSLSDHTGNPFFALERLLLRWYTRAIDRRASAGA